MPVYPKLQKIILPSLIFVTLVSIATAQPVYLSCTVPPEKKTPALRFDFTLDETAGTVSFYWEGQNSLVKQSAVFSADAVIWNQPFYMNSIIRRAINRVTLEYTEVTIDGHKETASKGACKIVTPSADRKF